MSASEERAEKQEAQARTMATQLLQLTREVCECENHTHHMPFRTELPHEVFSTQQRGSLSSFPRPSYSRFRRVLVCGCVCVCVCVRTCRWMTSVYSSGYRKRQRSGPQMIWGVNDEPHAPRTTVTRQQKPNSPGAPAALRFVLYLIDSPPDVAVTVYQTWPS